MEEVDDTRVQENILLSHPRTLSEAVRTATEIESIRNARAKRAGKPQVAAVQVKKGSPGKSAAAAAGGKAVEANPADGIAWDIDGPCPCAAQGKECIKYFYCKKKRHMQRECQQQKRDDMQCQMMQPTLAMKSTFADAPPEHLNQIGLGLQPPAQPSN